MDEIKLRAYDGIAIAGFLTLPGLLYTAPGIIAEQSGQSAWMAAPAAHVLMLCAFLIISVLMRRYKGMDIIETTSFVIGKPAGIFYGAALFLYFCFTAGILIREGSEILKTYGLSMTPAYAIAALILLSAFVMNLFGGRSIIKSAGFFFIFTILGIVFIMLLGFNRYNPDHLFPVLGNGIRNMAKSARYTAGMLDGILILALFAPGFENTGVMRKSGVIALSVSAVLSGLFYLCLIMMFSAPVASETMSGYIEMGKSIYYNHFFYRFESVLLFFLIFASVITASIGLLAARKGAAFAFGIKSPKTAAFACSALALAAALIPANLLDLMDRYLAAIRWYGAFFTAGFPLLLFIVSSVKRILKYEKY